MAVVWTVGAGDGKTVGDIVRRAGGDATAVEEGRVFVGRRRARAPSDPVRAGDEVRVAPPALRVAVKLLFRSSEVVVAEKPAGMPTIADHGGEAHTLVAAVAREVGTAPSRLHPTSRLDRGVSGIVTFARTPRAQSVLAGAREEGRYQRRYLAIATRAPEPEHGTWDAPIGRAQDPRLRMVRGRDATSAETRYATVARAGLAALLCLTPITGRTHQLRVHAADARAPLYGDRDYGGPQRLTLPDGKVMPLERIALHAVRVVVTAPRLFGFTAESPVPKELRDLWLSLGGDDAAWDTAITFPLDAP